jgi:peroxidase
MQGIAHAEEYVQGIEKAEAEEKETPEALTPKAKHKFFRKASAKSEAIGRARIKMEKAVKHAERILLDKKRLETAETAGKKELAEAIAEELHHKPGTILDKKELAHIYQASGCEPLRLKPTCSEIPFYHSIRTISGVCNNVEQPTKGSSFTPFSRILAAQYQNGIDTLYNQAERPSLGPFLPPFPSARLVSDTAIIDEEVDDNDLSHLIMQWGQFMDHDLDLQVEFAHQNCNLVDCTEGELCAPIKVPQGDLDFGRGTTNAGMCLPFQRSIAACEENSFDFSARQQVNELTHYMDASNVYGSTDARAAFLREFQGGRMRVGPDDTLPVQPRCAPTEGPLGQVTPGGNTSADCCMPGFATCVAAGDIRALEHVSLTVLHTVWLREHNRIAKALSNVNPHWEDERLYVESRKILIAEYQHITYTEYLPALFGENFEKFVGNYTGYNPNIDAAIPNSFATAAYRFGHSQIQPLFDRLDSSGNPVPAGPLNLRESFFSPTEFDNGGGVSPIVQGWVKQPARKTDEFVNSILTTQLFESNPGDGMDLVAINIQRSRDHGLPGYATWKRYCSSIFEAKSMFRSDLTAIRLEEMYGTEENIDLFSGSLAEEPLRGSVLGATLSCIIGITFSRLRIGDRFYYENSGPDTTVFTPQQLTEIKKTGLARVLCDNGGLQEVQANPFLLDPLGFEESQCNRVPGIDFTPWVEPTFCFYRASVIAQRKTVFSFFERPTGTGVADLRLFQFSTRNGNRVSRCIPFRCPQAGVKRDLLVSVPDSRSNSCTIQETGTSSATITVGQASLNQNGFYSSETECEAGNQETLHFQCDGLQEEIATTEELEKELAKVLADSGGDGGAPMTPTYLEPTVAPNPKIYSSDIIEVLKSTDPLPTNNKIPVSSYMHYLDS